MTEREARNCRICGLPLAVPPDPKRTTLAFEWGLCSKRCADAFYGTPVSPHAEEALTELIARYAEASDKPDSWDEVWRLAKAASLASKHLVDTGLGSAEYERATAELRDYLTADRILRMLP